MEHQSVPATPNLLERNVFSVSILIHKIFSVQKFTNLFTSSIWHSIQQLERGEKGGRRILYAHFLGIQLAKTWTVFGIFFLEWWEHTVSEWLSQNCFVVSQCRQACSSHNSTWLCICQIGYKKQIVRRWHCLDRSVNVEYVKVWRLAVQYSM